jgi:hypothetical protein
MAEHPETQGHFGMRRPSSGDHEEQPPGLGGLHAGLT